MTAQEFVSCSWYSDLLHRCRESRKLILFIVAIALLLDNMLLTTVVPIMPIFMYEHRQNNNIHWNDSDLKLEGNYTTANSLDVRTTSTSVKNSEPRPQPTQTEEERHEQLKAENLEIGLMLASKAIVQMLANPFVGPLTNRIGYNIPMFIGFFIIFLSTFIFAFGQNYSILFAARAMQGVGASCSTVAGMAMLADRYPDDDERGKAMGFALGGMALGVLIGPSFGAVMYQFVGKTAPFLILAFLALGDGVLLFLVLQPTVKKQTVVGPTLFQLLKDPYILVAAGAITVGNMGIAMLEPSLPIYMMDTMHSSGWQLGVVFLPASTFYIIGANIFGPLGRKIGRWLASLLGLIVIGICIMLVPLARQFNHLIAPNAGLGFAMGMVDSTMMPHLGYLVDIRHSAVYGSVYAIGDVAFCIGFAVGPAFSGFLVEWIGFSWMLYGMAIVNLFYAPFMIFLREPQIKEEKKFLKLGNDCNLRYGDDIVSHTKNEDSDPGK